MNKTEWLSLKLHCEAICNLVYQLNSAEEVSLEQQLESELELELTSMKILTLQLRGQICYSPVAVVNLEAHS